MGREEGAGFRMGNICILMRVKEERGKVGLKLNIKKKKKNLRSRHLTPSLANRRVKGRSGE